jgi:Right handed beta helix region
MNTTLLLLAASFASHAPMRPLPEASQRELTAGKVFVVDAAKGRDENNGAPDTPWRTVSHALAKMSEGGVLALRGGTHYTHASIMSTKPLTIRAWPGELAVLDGGFEKFANSPASAWEACADGVKGEFRSVKAYPLAKPATGEEDGDGAVLVMGRFIDSMVPLHGARFRGDLQSDNPRWNIDSKSSAQQFVSCGPAVWQDGKTGHLHCRLTHTQLPGLGADNYRGETDVRKMPLCVAVAASGPVLSLKGARNVTLQDIVIRGSTTSTLEILQCADITLEGVTVYGGGRAVLVKDTSGLRMTHSAVRGVSAPWHYRGAMKYRSVEARLFSATQWMPSGVDSRDFEIAYCEFTDSEDGVFFGCVRGVRFHHNLVENITDDGIFVTASTGWDGVVAGGDMRIWQNRLSRCLTTFAFGVGHGRQITLPERVQTGDGIYITRNVIDARRPVHYHWPKNATDPQEPSFRTRFGGDHGSPAWEPMWVYHNTFIGSHLERPDFGSPGLGAGMGKGTTRSVLNNILCADIGNPGLVFPQQKDRFDARGNVIWSFDPEKKLVKPGEAEKANFITDPGFVSYSADWRQNVDLRPKSTQLGVELPAAWFDPIRDRGIGAVPAGAEPWRVGMHGRMDVFGRPLDKSPVQPFAWSFPDHHDVPPVKARALSLQGYPAFDSPIIDYVMRRHGIAVDSHEREFVPLTTEKLADKKLLVIDGSFARAKMTPDVFGASDVAALEAWLQQGGTLILFSQRMDVFKGSTFLTRLAGAPPRAKPETPVIANPAHPWLRGITGTPAWLSKAFPLAAMTGESIISAGPNFSVLWRNRVGRGRVIYIGWSIGGQLTDNRRGGAVETDAAMIEQVKVLGAIIQDATGMK